MCRDEKFLEFSKKLEHLLNECGIDNELKTPDYILATYLYKCLQAYDRLLSDLDKHQFINQ